VNSVEVSGGLSVGGLKRKGDGTEGNSLLLAGRRATQNRVEHRSGGEGGGSFGNGV